MPVPSFFPYAQIQQLDVVGPMTIPAASVTDTHISGSGATAVQATKVQQQRDQLYSQDRNNFNAADWKAIRLVYGAVGLSGPLWAKLPVACTSGSTCTVTWRKNGTSIGTVTFTDADPANHVRTATASDTALVTTDDLSVQITVSGGTPGKGIMANAVVKEYAV